MVQSKCVSLKVKDIIKYFKIMDTCFVNLMKDIFLNANIVRLMLKIYTTKRIGQPELCRNDKAYIFILYLINMRPVCSLTSSSFLCL